MRRQVPVLTYHATYISGAAYEDNDHVALVRDLETIAALKVRICPLRDVVRAVETCNFSDVSGCVALTFDDGSDFDFHDLPHPTWGKQRGMLGILRDAAATGSHATLEATSFAIASPDARSELDRKELIGSGWWNDDWWEKAEQTGLMRIESHSWDHNQISLGSTSTSARRGSFQIVDENDADAEIRMASDYVRARRGRTDSVLFAYPYGDVSEYLATEYLPRGVDVHGVRAAFDIAGAPVSSGADIWRLPRYVFRCHWNDEEGLRRILGECR